MNEAETNYIEKVFKQTEQRWKLVFEYFHIGRKFKYLGLDMVVSKHRYGVPCEIPDNSDYDLLNMHLLYVKKRFGAHDWRRSCLITEYCPPGGSIIEHKFSSLPHIEAIIVDLEDLK